MWLFLGLLQLVALGDTVEGSLKSKMSKQECVNYIRKSDPQAETVLDCLITHYNLTQLLGQIHEKMNLIERKLKEALEKKQENQSRNPFKKIDDVLAITEGGSVANEDCQRQKHIVQALRRKLEWHNLINGIDTTQFSPKTRSLTNNEDPEPKLFRKSVVSDGVQCILINSLRNSGNKFNI